MYELNWSHLPDALPLLAKGALITAEITLVAVLFGIIWGTILALLRLSPFKPLSWFANAYVTLFRSIPLVMVLLWFFLIVPQLLHNILNLPPTLDVRLVSAMTAFALFEAAYYSEIIRAGIQSVSVGQMHAAQALGMPYIQAMRLVILPQAFRTIQPLLLTQGIVLLQDSSLVYVIGLADFFRSAMIVSERNGRMVEMILFAGVCYLVVCLLASAAVKSLKAKTNA